MGGPRVGDRAPEEMEPIASPSAVRTSDPARAARRPSATRPTSTGSCEVSAPSKAARPTKSCLDFSATTRPSPDWAGRSEEHTSELQSRGHLVCRLLLEKKKKKDKHDRQRSSQKENHH